MWSHCRLVEAGLDALHLLFLYCSQLFYWPLFLLCMFPCLYVVLAALIVSPLLIALASHWHDGPRRPIKVKDNESRTLRRFAS